MKKPKVTSIPTEAFRLRSARRTNAGVVQLDYEGRDHIDGRIFMAAARKTSTPTTRDRLVTNR